MDAEPVEGQFGDSLMDRLKPQTAHGGSVESLPGGGRRLSIPAGPAGHYRLAQLDDTRNLRRRDFNWQSPCVLTLRARVSDPDLPGTWGFGLWNDPFSASLGLGGGTRKLPALPNAAWFFHASPANALSLRDDLPANGFLAAGFSSRNLSPFLYPPAVLAAPLLAWRVTARWLRRAARRWIREDSTRLNHDPTAWHDYRLGWRLDGAVFQVDGQSVMESSLAPRCRLGLVIWIDNQFAAFKPDGTLKYGVQENPTPAWLEVADLNIESGG
ncbi:MAG: hypothetical protein D9V45_02855 [Chloroflexi bacterium]|nr:MAG: hypothetical protein D9V45_02855 [Chloroflexota bacterium]